jgi:hypothetical protein
VPKIEKEGLHKGGFKFIHTFLYFLIKNITAFTKSNSKNRLNVLYSSFHTSEQKLMAFKYKVFRGIFGNKKDKIIGD